ncbi:RadC family protein [Paraglaciecola chathamensis]|uniref:DNA repair protein RadC n=1 Tax=Paraglaciecola chathamensis S18K6 TaxID=1127672 RepID=A0AAV3V7C7_9ALTE|nr:MULTISPECIES: DNA repair protein RadC [Paraglaciecola]MBN23498.1 JAB domain-containing protein [Alteromonadaceae bacterium]GAC12500.1 DNA repair protein RadC [Paraglaciecola chathamensis S18K6]|tara:strand:+ start:24507 stop:25181 length:675 start_codon:yes stop_codon:yes gene_type:complete
MKITQWPAHERPREKLLTQGPSALSDAELLAIFLRTGIKGLSAVDLARNLLNTFGSLRGLISASQQDFCLAKGLGEAKFVQLQASIELSQRFFAEQLQRETVFNSAQQTKHFLISQLRDEPNEVFGMLLLDSQHQLIKFRKMFFGTIDSASVYPRVLVKQALEDNAAAVILTHNHPSGVAEPSQADEHITARIISAMGLLDIKVLDHLVVGDGVAVSFAERGLI